MYDPDGRTWFKVFRFSLPVETQAERVVVIIANNPLGLPGGKDLEQPLPQFRPWSHRRVWLKADAVWNFIAVALGMVAFGLFAMPPLINRSGYEELAVRSTTDEKERAVVVRPV